ncbi:MAG: hypothetical protein VCD34_00065 [Planctomycetota bacterium]|jgi:hypothetical protein
MFSEPSTISLLCECVHLPAKYTIERVREVYNKICTTCGYENFIRTSTGARIERRGPGGRGFSRLTLTGDRFQFAEDHMGITAEQFGRKVKTVLEDAMPALGIPAILVQQVTARATCMPNAISSAREFLSSSIFRVQGEDLQGFGRPAGLHGFRLVFPADRERPGAFNVRVEAYLRDPRSIYIENVGTYKAPIQVKNLDGLQGQIEEVSEFILTGIVPFLSKYDRRDRE